MLGEEMPITGLCIVEQTCPAGYIMVDKCEDNSRVEADLWKDHIFARKVKRFLCVTRVFPLSQGTLNNVLIDVYIHEEKDPPPAGFCAITTTQDTQELSLKRKMMSVKLVPRDQATDAVNDIQFLCKSKKPPPGYSIVGELNGLMLCYRIEKIPQTSPPAIPPRPQQPPAQQQYTPYQVPPVQNVPLQGHLDAMYGNAATSSTLSANAQQSRIHPLSGVPFEINPKLTAEGQASQGGVAELRFRSRENIMHEFDYTFFVERQAQHTSQNYNGM